jgi:hypothetical protein
MIGGGVEYGSNAVVAWGRECHRKVTSKNREILGEN